MTTGMVVNGEDLLFMNGASEQIIETCNSFQNYQTNQISPLSNELKQKIIRELE